MNETGAPVGDDIDPDLAAFEAPVRSEAAPDGAALNVDVEGFEGPLDLLLSLARTQKVDLKKISILALADQYLAFIAAARRMRLELAADYLVMAAWLAYLKSRLILPEAEATDEPTGEELAQRLALQLRRLEAIRTLATRLMGRDRLGREIFARGMPEGIRIVRTPRYEASLFELLKAYADQRVRESVKSIRITRAPVYSVEEARARLEAILGTVTDWSQIERLLPPELRASELGRSAFASTFVASLEMCREGHLDLRQLVPFGPLYIRARSEHASDAPLPELEMPLSAAVIPDTPDTWGEAIAAAFEEIGPNTPNAPDVDSAALTPNALLAALERFTETLPSGPAPEDDEESNA